MGPLYAAGGKLPILFRCTFWSMLLSSYQGQLCEGVKGCHERYKGTNQPSSLYCSEFEIFDRIVSSRAIDRKETVWVGRGVFR